MIPQVFRAGAIIIAIAAIVDPAITSSRRTRPEIAVVSADASRDSALTERVARDLARDFTVVKASYGGAAATVFVGDRLPRAHEHTAVPTFAVLPEAREGVTLTAVHAPARTPVDARVRIIATTRVRGAQGRTLEVRLHAGEATVDHVTRSIPGNDEVQAVPLVFVPSATGAVKLRVSARLEDADEEDAAAELVIDVRDERWSVLFYDSRPSWLSTFVRRAIEQDPRFAVTSRILTSRNLTSDAGQPPALEQASSGTLFDAIVIGAPETLSDRELSGVQAFMRERAGAVVLLLDTRDDAQLQRLTEIAQWGGTTGGNAKVVNAAAYAAGAGMRAAELAWPLRLPPAAQAIASDSANHAIVWESAVGSGRLIVSGALDAWKFRDEAVSGFTAFWQTLIAEAADAAAPPLEISIERPVITPGAATDVIVTVRDAVLADVRSGAVRAAVSAEIVTSTGVMPLRLWPDGPVGVFRGTVQAPGTPGTYRITAKSGGARADALIEVASSVDVPYGEQRDIVKAWASASGGTAITESSLDELPAAIKQVLQPKRRAETWYPMRSAWWIIPFTIALAVEWWWRRRRGLA